MMKNVFRVLGRFLVLNVCVLIPCVWVMIWHFPSELEFFFKSDVPVALRVGQKINEMNVAYKRSLGCALNARDRPAARTFIAEPYNQNRLAFEFVGGPASISLDKITLTRNLFFRRVLDVRQILDSFDLNGGTFQLNGGALVVDFDEKATLIPRRDCLGWSVLSFNGSKFHRKRLLVIPIVELLLLLISCMLHTKPFTLITKSILIRAVVVAMACAVFACLSLPLQTYFGNAAVFPFSAVQYLGDICASFVIVIVVLSMLQSVLIAAFGERMIALLPSWLTYSYLQTGILSASLPPLNGDLRFFYEHAELAFVDGLTCVGVFALFYFCFRWLRDYIHLIALSVMILSLLALFDVKGATSHTEKKIYHTWTNTTDEVITNFRFSPKRNLLFLMPDTFQADVAEEILKDSPEIRKLFDGFVAFGNNVGVGEFTHWGFPPLFTGVSYKEGDILDYYYSFTRRGSVLCDIASQNIPLSVVSGTSGCNFSNCRTNIESLIQRESDARPECSTWLRRSQEIPYFNLADIIVYRLTPFFAKAKILEWCMMGIDARDDSCPVESSFYPRIGRAMVDCNLTFSVGVFASNGLHTPLMFDRNGARLSSAPQNRKTLYEQAYYVLNTIGGLMKMLRERQLYDKTMVIIAADHGSGVCETRLMGGDVIPGRMNPILWVKPFRKEDSFLVDPMPTSQINVHKLIRNSISNDLDVCQIREFLKSNRRVFRFVENQKIRDVVIGQDGRVQ